MQGLLHVCDLSIHFLLTVVYCGAGIDLVARVTGT